MPVLKPGHVLIQNRASVISSGTERMLLEFGQASLLGKALQQPGKVRQVVDKIGADGLGAAWEAVQSKLSIPISLGYSSAGEVLAVGEGVTDLVVGDYVASNGPHAEVVCVPRNLCVKYSRKNGPSFEHAAFATLGSIALQGVRLIDPDIGENFVVMGLGLLGLSTVQILQANGCRVLGMDYDKQRLAIAASFGAVPFDLGSGADPLAAAAEFSRSAGVDGVLITVSSESSDPIHQAATMCRKRGRIVLVGVTGLNLRRDDFFEKELTFQVSCSYGPGRYDRRYEEQGNDYPLAFVRWTENRNMEAMLDMVASGRFDVKPLISHRFPVEQAEQAYQALKTSDALGIVLTYRSEPVRAEENRVLYLASSKPSPVLSDGGGAAIVGAGSFTTKVILPAIKKARVQPVVIASEGGVSGTSLSKQFGAKYSTTDVGFAMSCAEANSVFIATRHESHAGLAIAALKNGKHVFVEKPLAVSAMDLDSVEKTLEQIASKGHSPLLMVGFNRRFAPLVVEMKSWLSETIGARTIVMTVNAGAPATDHWTSDANQGGRWIGELCHFLDLAIFLAGADLKDCSAVASGSTPADDSVMVQMAFENGTAATIHYIARGHRSFPKERIQVFAGNRVMDLDNYRRLTGYGWKRSRKVYRFRQDKGHYACVQAFFDAIKNGSPSPILVSELFLVSRLAIEIAQKTKAE